MSDPAAPPAMDEILASIRRIIAEDPPLDRAAAPDRDASPDDGEVLELGEPIAPATATSTAGPHSAVSSPAVSPAAAPPAADALLSARAETASRSALAALGELRIDPHAADDTMDGLVRELVRPLLKQWLDANLPEIVERLVAREVARLGGR